MIDQTNMNQVGKDESKPSTLQTNFKQTGRCNIFESSATMYHPLENLFESTMIREGREVTAVTSGQTFTAFMRREDDGNSKEDRIKIFYPIDAPINQGMIIAYGTKKYILINRETEENECYYKSYAVACNATISLNDGSIIGVPSYTADMERALEYSGSVFSIIQGNMEFICENNGTTRNFKVNDRFACFGRTFKITNTYYKDGMVHLIAEVALEDSHEPLASKIIVEGIEEGRTYTVGDMATILTTCTINDKPVDATLRYDTSNQEVAVVDGTGLVQFKGEGDVTISVYWVEQNQYETVNVKCNMEQILEKYRISISYSGATPIIKVGGSYKTFTAHIYNLDGEELTDITTGGTWTWVKPDPSLPDPNSHGEEYYNTCMKQSYQLTRDGSDYVNKTVQVIFEYEGVTATVDCQIQFL